MLPQLDSTYFVSQLFWLVVCFAILILLFKMVFIPRMNSVLKKRDTVMTEGKNAISKLESEISNLKDEIKTIKDREIQESAKIIKSAISRSEKMLSAQLKYIKNENAEALLAERLKHKSELQSLKADLQNLVTESSQVFLDKLFLRDKNV